MLRLTSGRQFAGTIDARSNDQELVLCSSSGGFAIRRPIQWERIVSATLGGELITVAELRERARGVEAVVVEPREWAGERGQKTVDSDQQEQQSPSDVQGVLYPVTTISFDARIANWDADVETDGLVVDLFPLDGEGYLAPVSGAVEIELFGPQRRVFHHAPLSGGDTLERIERWVVQIDPLQFTSGGVRLKLPFGAVHPEIDTDWVAWHYGLVHVRLVAPGHGTFDASRDGIRIRPWAPVRDQLELNTNRRFFPTEALGRRN